MSETQEVASGSTDQSSADGLEQSQKDSVAYETYRKVLSEKKRRDAELKDALDRLNHYETEAKTREEQELKSKDEWKKLLEIREAELHETKSKLSQVFEQQVNTAKLTTFFDSLDGKVAKKYWDKIPLDAIVYDDSAGEIDKASVQRAIERFKKEYPEVIMAESGPKVTSVAPSTAAKDSKEDMYAKFAKSMF
jgi:hypothetical protein